MPKLTDTSWVEMNLQSLDAEDFCYLDPPYYENKAGYSIDTVVHPAFLATIQNLRCRWLLSGYTSDLYLTNLGDPYATKDVSFRAKRSAPGVKLATRLECVWKNY